MSGNKNAANIEKPLDIPKELWMMVDTLFRSAIKQVTQWDWMRLKFTVAPLYFKPKKKIVFSSQGEPVFN